MCSLLRMHFLLNAKLLGAIIKVHGWASSGTVWRVKGGGLCGIPSLDERHYRNSPGTLGAIPRQVGPYRGKI